MSIRTTLGPVTFETCPAQGVQFHEFAKLFPMIQGEALAELSADIRANGVQEPFVFIGREILDGRNRYMIARELGIAYPRCEYLGDDPLGFVISKNMHRRHLSESQRAMVAGRLANMRQGERTDLEPSANLPKVSTAGASAMLNVSDRSVTAARKVRNKGDESLIEAVERGEVAVSTAAKIAVLPKSEQAEIVAKGEVRQEARDASAPIDDPYGFARLTPSALIAEATGLRQQVEEQSTALTTKDAEIAALKAQKREFSETDQGRVISNLHRQLATVKLKRDEAMAAARRAEYRRKKAEEERDEARANQLIHL
ncbi:MAG: ParB/RepB/Spo0J family partition protein [Pseudomonadota bacterium]